MDNDPRAEVEKLEALRRRRLKAAWVALVAVVFAVQLAGEREGGFAGLRRPLVLAFGRPARAMILSHETVLKFREVRHLIRFQYVARPGRSEGVTLVPWGRWNEIKNGDGAAIHYIPGLERSRLDWAFLDDDLGFSRGQYLRLALVLLFGGLLIWDRWRSINRPGRSRNAGS